MFELRALARPELRKGKMPFAGSIEVHHRNAWPDVDHLEFPPYLACPEHGTPCARSVTRIQGNIRRVYML
jgi:hypothetical protein